MTSSLVSAYDRSLGLALSSVGLQKSELGVYARSDNKDIWKGLWLNFNQKLHRVQVAPILGIFCPLASSIADQGYKTLFGNAALDQSCKLGRPIIGHPLYDLVKKQRGEDRFSFSYDIEASHEIDNSTRLIKDDFSKVADDFFEHTSTIQELRDRVVSHPNGATTGIDAMVLTYLIDPQISLEELERLTYLSPNPMTKEFALYFKTKIVEKRSRLRTH